MQEIELLKLMLEHQDQLNSQIHPNWREQNFPWHRAIWMECAELMDCFPWKWWADTEREVDWDNVKIELADIWHFILSWIIEEYQDLIPTLMHRFDVAYNCWNTNFPHDLIILDESQSVIEVLTGYAIRKQFLLLWEEFASLCSLCEISFKDLARIYFGKNVLNRFRQEHGLKEGRYSRLWNGVEDNKVTLRLIEDLEVLPLEHFEVELTRRLEAEYEASVS